jgi:hypothetical protein
MGNPPFNMRWDVNHVKGGVNYRLADVVAVSATAGGSQYSTIEAIKSLISDR